MAFHFNFVKKVPLRKAPSIDVCFPINFPLLPKEPKLKTNFAVGKDEKYTWRSKSFDAYLKKKSTYIHTLPGGWR